MTDVMITDAIKQTVITRLATINSAISILTLTHGKPATVTVDEVFDLAERIEHRAWRDLLNKNGGTRAEEVSAEPAPPTPPAQAPPEPPRPTPAPQQWEPRSNGDGQTAGEASAKKINATFAVGKSKGYRRVSSSLKTSCQTGRFLSRSGRPIADSLSGQESEGKAIPYGRTQRGGDRSAMAGKRVVFLGCL